MEGHDVTKLASMAKLKAGRLAREIADGCLQFWGGMGYTQVGHVIMLTLTKIWYKVIMVTL